MSKHWFDIQWRDTKGNVLISHEFADTKLAAKEQFLSKLNGYARNGSEFRCFDFISPNGPLPLTQGCCIR